MKSPTMRGSQPKLSDVAKHLVIPDGIVTTGWPAVRDKLADLGVVFDRWQEGLATVTLGKRADGIYAAAVGGVTWSIPRQVGKTFTVGHIIFALCMLQPGTTVLWTAHRSRTSDETFEDMKGMASKPKIAPYMDEPRNGAGQQAIRFKNGSRILFGAREQGFGRGFTGVGIAVFDEAQILSERAIDDMVPATNSVENALIIKIGTPPKPVDPSEIFTDARERALSGKAPDALYVELGADEGASPDDWEQIARANPSFPHRTTKTAILRMKGNMTEESFIREAMGVWDEVRAGKRAIERSKWDALKIGAAHAPQDGRSVFAVKFAPDGSGVALAGAVRPKEGPVHVEGIEQRPMSEGTEWLIDFLVERHKDAAQIVIDGKYGVGFLVQALKDAGVRNKRQVILPNTAQVVSAHSMFLQAVNGGELSTIQQDEVDEQVYAAEFREIGKDGGFGWAASGEGSVLLLEAMTYAFWGAKTTKRNPSGDRGAVEVF